MVTREVCGQLPLIVPGPQATDGRLVRVSGIGEGFGTSGVQEVVLALPVIAKSNFVPALVEGGDHESGGDPRTFGVGGLDVAEPAAGRVPAFSVFLPVRLGFILVTVAVDSPRTRAGRRDVAVPADVDSNEGQQQGCEECTGHVCVWCNFDEGCGAVSKFGFGVGRKGKGYFG